MCAHPGRLRRCWATSTGVGVGATRGDRLRVWKRYQDGHMDETNLKIERPTSNQMDLLSSEDRSPLEAPRFPRLVPVRCCNPRCNGHGQGLIAWDSSLNITTQCGGWYRRKSSPCRVSTNASKLNSCDGEKVELGRIGRVDPLWRIGALIRRRAAEGVPKSRYRPSGWVISRNSTVVEGGSRRPAPPRYSA